ncbi:tetratricopeptide repeat protein [Sorangium sp. So ce1000]|uniref:tetratricopeptide repeat protein n=1 Tax=Sorangium sp. So ce1000 TaxID=3133325 RepID=UPI003F638A31
MLRRTGCLFACAALSGLLGCTERSRAEAAPAEIASTGRSAEAPAPSSLDAARALALAAPAGASAVDREIEALARRLAKAPGGADLWSALGHAWIRKARASDDPSLYRRARACAEVALALAEGDRASLDLLGLVLLHERRFAEARDAAERVLSRDQGDALALGTLSDAALELGAFEVAARTAQRMVDQRPGLPSYARAATLRWLQGDAATAIYTEDTLAWALYRAGKLAEARRASDRALALGTRDARLLYHAGSIRIALGDLTEGERLVRAALDLNPGFDMTGAAEAEQLLAQRKAPRRSAR